MRPGSIIAIFAVVVALIGGVIWYTNSQAENARVEQEQSEQAAQIARDEDTAREEEAAREEERARQQDEAAAAEQAEWDAAEEARMADEAAAGTQDEAASADDAPIVVGDEITEDTIVVESAADAPTILDPEDTATSAEIINGADPAATPDTARNTGAGAPAATEPEQVLTPENFNRDEVLALIDDSAQLSDDDRSGLRALVDGATANPAMVEATINSIRAALDLPPLN